MESISHGVMESRGHGVKSKVAMEPWSQGVMGSQ